MAKRQKKEDGLRRAAAFRARAEAFYDELAKDGQERQAFQTLLSERCSLMMEGIL